MSDGALLINVLISESTQPKIKEKYLKDTIFLNYSVGKHQEAETFKTFKTFDLVKEFCSFIFTEIDAVDIF